MPNEILEALIDPESDYEDSEGAVNNVSDLPMSPNGALDPLEILMTTLGETDTHHSPMDLRTSDNETINPLPSSSARSGPDEAMPLAQSFAMDFQPSQSVVNTQSIRGNRTRSRRLIAKEKKRRGASRKDRGALSTPTRGTRAVNGESGCRRGQKVLEVYTEDQDVPPSLQTMMSRNTDINMPNEILEALIDPESDYENNEGAVNNASDLPMSPNGTIDPLEILTTTLGETDTHHSPMDLRTMSDNETLNPFCAMDFQPSQSVVNTQSIRGKRARPRRLIATEKRREGASRKGRGALSTPTRGARGVHGDSGCRRGQKITEVYTEDQDVSPSLQKMVNDMENARAIRMQGMKDRRQNATAKADSDIDDYQDEHFEAKGLFDGDLDATVFKWAPMASFKGYAEEFQPKNAGPTVPVTSAYEAFRIYWDDDILQHIVRETNRYAVELSSTSERFARDWVDTNVDEILILFAFWMMNGVIKMPSIKSCFSTNSLLKTGIFRSLLTEARYWNLNRALHFVNNKTRTPNSSKFLPLGPLVEHLNSKFQQAYNLHQNVVVNEPLTLWKGNLYIKRKPVRFDIKSFDLCESNTGYLWSFIIYTGKDDASEGKPRSLEITDLVVQLMRPLLNKGHTLFLNSWFNSPLLARYLKRNKTDCVGTLQKSRNHVPPLLKLATLSEGTCVARHSGDVVVMAYQDKKTVYTISTCHGTELVQLPSKPGRPSHYTPAVIADYNCSMGGVDQKDQMLEPYLLERKRNRKWYKKIFRRLLNASIFNSRILVDQSSAGGVKQVAYRLDLVNSIIEQHLARVPKPRQRQVIRGAPILPLRFSGNQHFIVRSEVNGARTVGSSRSSAGRAVCLLCQLNKKKTKKTVYKCKTCDVPLCLEGCFESFHTP